MPGRNGSHLGSRGGAGSCRPRVTPRLNKRHIARCGQRRRHIRHLRTTILRQKRSTPALWVRGFQEVQAVQERTHRSSENSTCGESPRNGVKRLVNGARAPKRSSSNGKPKKSNLDLSCCVTHDMQIHTPKHELYSTLRRRLRSSCTPGLISEACPGLCGASVWKAPAH
jgi:hypothetical protein